MKGSFFIIIGLLTTLLVLSSCSDSTSDSSMKVINEGGDSGSSGASQELSLSCSEKSIVKCEKQSSDLMKDGCYEDYAEARLDPCLCEMIGSSMKKGSCFSKIAIGLKDPKYCSEAYLKGDCYENLAYLTGDEKLCDKASTAHKELCHKVFKAADTVDDPCSSDTIPACDPGSKDFVNEVNSRLCYMGVAKILGNPCVCDMMEDGVFKEGCYSKIALEMKDPSICLKKGSDIQKHSCITDLAISLKDPSLCERSPWDAFGNGGANACYKKYAEMWEDPGICDLIGTKVKPTGIQSAEKLITICKTNIEGY